MIRAMRTALILGSLAVACGEEGGELDEPTATTADAFSLDDPKPMNIDLRPGQWIRDQRLTRRTDGFHVYDFRAPTSGIVTFRMEAAKENTGLTSYLRIIDPAQDRQRFARREQWASHGNAVTNRCDVLVEVEAGRVYQVVATSNQNADQGAHVSDGPYSLVVFYQTRLNRSPLTFP